MKSCKLTKEEEAQFQLFLKWACRAEPSNFEEWGEQYVRLCNMKEQISLYVTESILKCSENEAWAVHNYFADYVEEACLLKMGEEIFKERYDLFLIINTDLCGSEWSPLIFIPNDYEIIDDAPVLQVNPLISLEDLVITP